MTRYCIKHKSVLNKLMTSHVVVTCSCNLLIVTAMRFCVMYELLRQRHLLYVQCGLFPFCALFIKQG